MISESGIKTEWTVASVCCGIGGGALGFAQALTEYAGVVGTFTNLYGIDVDSEACADFENLTGVPAFNLDLFDRQQYIDWWTGVHEKESKKKGFNINKMPYRLVDGKVEPPEDWREITPDDIRALSNGIAPDVVFFSAPCKGFSGLLPTAQSESKMYQALNRLYYRIMELYILAFPEDGPALIISENVPRIKSRGEELLEAVQNLVESHGYAFHNSDHDCGEIGGLAQKRHRNMSVARNLQRCPVWLYQAPKRKHLTIGDVIGMLPMPGDIERGGRMHGVPKLQRKVWERLAAIKPGGDWRDLLDFHHKAHCIINLSDLLQAQVAAIVEDLKLQHSPRNNAWNVQAWDDTSNAVTGGAGVGRSNGVQAVADPRPGNCSMNRHKSHYAMVAYDQPAGTVTGASHIGNGRICVSDVRLKERASRHPGVYAIVPWEAVSPTVTGTRIGSGAICVEDQRLAGGYANKHKVLDWDNQATTVTGMKDVQSGAQSIADPRPTPGTHSRPQDYGVLGWDGASPTIRGAGRTMNSASSVADPRIGSTPRVGTYGVMDMYETAATIIGSADVHAGTAAVADDRDTDEWDISKVASAQDLMTAKPTDRGVWIILSPHSGAWHRPLTTYELAMLQGFPRYMPDGKSPLQLVGKNDAKWRERIGNAVPPAAARAIAETMLVSLMASSAGETFIMSTEPIWVVPEESDDLERVH